MLDALARVGADSGPGRVTAPAELAVVIPTLNEAENIPLLVGRLDAALSGIAWEVIFVDDNSTDGTAAAARQLAQHDPRVRCLKRLGRRGLAGACIEGALSTSAEIIAVMDADLQHDETCLPLMLAAIREGADLAIGTRRLADDGTVAGGFSALRRWGSRLATEASRRLTGVAVADPMSGFFMLRRDAFEAIAPRLSTQGFKLLLDLLLSHRGPLQVREIAYGFRPRQHGRSKLDSLVVLEFAGLLLAKATGDAVSIRFLLFLLVGASGLVMHLAVLRTALGPLALSFDYAQAVAAFAAMTWNFALNNWLTYHDRRLTGLAAVRGLFTFYAVCSVGAVANVGVASWVYGGRPSWWLAGTAGALMGAVFNYAASSVFTWRQR